MNESERARGAAVDDDTVNAPSDDNREDHAPTMAYVQAEIDEMQQQLADYLDQAQRARAELINVRRRMEQEQERLRQRAAERLVSKLLPVVDDFGRALRSVPAEISGNGWLEGIRLIERKLWNVLDAEGVAAIESVGKPFDPSLHEAVAVDESGGNIVIEEYQPGYTMHGSVLRPAMVKVGSVTTADA